MASNHKLPPARDGVFTEGVIGLDGEPYVPGSSRLAGYECGVYEAFGDEPEVEEKPEVNKKIKKLKDISSVPNPIYDQHISITKPKQIEEDQSTSEEKEKRLYDFAEECGAAQKGDRPENRIRAEASVGFQDDFSYIPMRNCLEEQSGRRNLNAPINSDDYNDDEHIYESLSIYQDHEGTDRNSRQNNLETPAVDRQASPLPEHETTYEQVAPCSYHVIKEIIDTEESYFRDLEVTVNEIKKPLMEGTASYGSKVSNLFINIEEVRDFSFSLLQSFQVAAQDLSDPQPNIGRVFLENFDEMRSVYGTYCRNHGDTHKLLQKLNCDSQFQNLLLQCMRNASAKTNVIDLPSLLIKPVQRVLKYPLLLRELEKKTKVPHQNEDDSWYKELKEAAELSRQVASDINEKKRGIDIVKKYRTKSEPPKATGDLMHSFKKKRDRFSMKIAHATGRQRIIDEEFNTIEERFDLMKDVLTEFLSNCNSYLTSFSQIVTHERHLAEDIPDFYGSDCYASVTSFEAATVKIKDYLFENFCKQVQDKVILPVQLALNQMAGPELLINKRFDKLLDYEKSLEHPDERTQMAKSIYEALNQQLLDELTKLCNFAFELLDACLKVFVKFQIKFYQEMLDTVEPICRVFTSQEATNKPFKLELISEQFNRNFLQVKLAMGSLAIVPNMIEDNTMQSSRSTYSRIYSGVLRNKHNVQTNSSKEKLLSDFKEEDLYMMTKDFSSTDKTDISANKHDLIGVIKRKDPLGNNAKWFCHNGVSEGFIPFDLLKLYKPAVVSISPLYETIPAFDVYSSISPYSSYQIKRPPDPSINHSPYSVRQRLSRDQSSTSSQIHLAARLQGDVFDVEDEMLDDTEYGSLFGYQTTSKKTLYVVQHDFTSTTSLTISVKRNEVVTMIMPHDVDSDHAWWLVAKGDGKQGYVPRDYMRKL